MQGSQQQGFPGQQNGPDGWQGGWQSPGNAPGAGQPQAPGRHPAPGAPGWQPGAPGPAMAQPPTPAVRPVGPLLMILGAVATAVGLFLPWYAQRRAVTEPGSGIRLEDGGGYNAFAQVQVVLHNDGVLGALFLGAMLIALVACILAVIAAIVSLATRTHRGGLALTAAVLGLVATLGLLVVFLMMAGPRTMIGVWVFGLSFIPVLVGAIGLTSKKF